MRIDRCQTCETKWPVGFWNDLDMDTSGISTSLFWRLSFVMGKSTRTIMRVCSIVLLHYPKVKNHLKLWVDRPPMKE